MDDEFYTTYESIEEELAHYSSHSLEKISVIVMIRLNQTSASTLVPKI